MSRELHLNDIGQYIGETCTLADTGDAVPAHWEGYKSDSQDQRTLCAQAELAALAPYFPETAKGLKDVTVDGFLFKSPGSGLRRALTVRIDGAEYVTLSQLPWKFQSGPMTETGALFRDRIHPALHWIYQDLMGSLTNLYGYVGFKPASALRAMADEEDVWAELSWYDRFKRDGRAGSLYEIFSSGGGGYLFVDLGTSWKTRDDFLGYYVSVDEEEFVPERIDLMPYLDAWMAIGLAEADIEH